MGRPGLAGIKADYAQATNPDCERGSADEVLEGADVYIGLSQPGAVSFDGIRSMADDAIVFAMANPTPEVAPDELEGLAAVVATGRSDYPNQINNVLAFPGVFRGALDVRARDITEGMKFAAGEAIAAVVTPDELGPEYIVPSVFNREVARVVAAAVAEAAERDGVARRLREACNRAARSGWRELRKRASNRAHGLSDPLLVLDEREADEALAAGPEADSRAHGDVRLARQLDGERRVSRAAGTALGSAPRRTSFRAGARRASRRARARRRARRGDCGRSRRPRPG